MAAVTMLKRIQRRIKNKGHVAEMVLHGLFDFNSCDCGGCVLHHDGGRNERH